MVEKIKIFEPKYGSGVLVASVTSTSASSSLRSRDEGNGQIVVTNLGSVTIYVRAGDSSVTATTADYPVLPLTQVVLSLKTADTYIAYVTASSSSSAHIILGDGA